ncbi:alpha/beta fold hydrolase [Sphingomonas oryzagri]|uniref:Alpha/beta hydrolase n=1 Tax=Sphingomonas oryzagri TaxID=3042314 RepID=A0ABT6MZ38_9SPHN|nr:alpha/beta hydrolase [Sphingomonas oryzagri]MDH7638318.1 alpha/beta hydrolase [Sphingomonas oryzagri]
MAARFIETNGVRLHVVEEGSGPLVLLCHGWPETAYSWRHQIGALAAAGYRVVAPDQRGYGASDAPEAVDAYDIAQLTGDLAGLVTALGAESAVVIGHDWGSNVAAHAALLRPDIFHALGLLSVPYVARSRTRPSARFERATRDREFYQAYFQQPGRVEAELEEDVRRALLGILYTAGGDRTHERPGDNRSFAFFAKGERMIDNLIVPDHLPHWLSADDLDVFTDQFRRSGFRGAINWYRNLDRNWAITPFLQGAKILQPTIYIAGSADGVPIMLADDVAAMDSLVPNLRGKHVLDGIGHWTQQEAPEAVTRLLLDFLGKLKAERG